MDDPKTLGLVGGVLLLLGVAQAAVSALRRRTDSGLDTAVIETFRLRVRAWLILFSILAAAFLLGRTTTVVLFGLIVTMPRACMSRYSRLLNSDHWVSSPLRRATTPSSSLVVMAGNSSTKSAIEAAPLSRARLSAHSM